MSWSRGLRDVPSYLVIAARAKQPSLIPTVASSDDITQEATRRLEENKHIAEQKIREATILAKMKELEYDALPKCKHGNVADAMLRVEHLIKYNVLHLDRQVAHYYAARYTCAECTKEIQEAEAEKAKVEAEKAKAEAKLLKDKEEAEKWERWRQGQEALKAAMKKRVEELKTKNDVVNACDFDETTYETRYLKRNVHPTLGTSYWPMGEKIGVQPYHLIGSKSIPGVNNGSLSHTAKYSTPIEWNTHYDDGLIPFLPVCPVCMKQTEMCSPHGNTGNPQAGPNYGPNIDRVECYGHYTWDATTNIHKKQTFQQQHVQKWTPEVVCYPGGGNMPVYKSVLENVPVMKDWDPKDPDGSIAAEAAKQKQITDLEHQVAELQTKIADLKA